MRNTRNFLLSTAIAVLAAGVPLGGPATAQPVPPPPPGIPAPGDLHVRIARPGRHHVWVGGFWHHTGTDWTWNDGRWIEPPRRHAHWVAPRYQKVRGGWRYVPGHWSHEHVIYD